LLSISIGVRGPHPEGPRNRPAGCQPAPLAVLIVAAVLAGCSQGPESEPTIGEAFAGPATLSLRKEIDPKSPVVGVAHHGDRLDITAQRRRWYKVRTAKGATGWTEDRDLLDTGQMNRLKDLAKETAGLPSQGLATSFDALNIHTEPNRLSASFLQVKEGEKFDVIAHRVLGRAPLPKRELVPPKPKPVSAKRAKKTAGSVPPPPSPAAPALPTDWVALSRARAGMPEEDMPPAARDDWTLIRTHDGQSGWVLTGRVYMSIPDEVAQYAEGHRITSYFSLGTTRDGDEKKDTWLWTTALGLGEDHDFDGYRIFSWNAKRHRYETTYIQRRERGYFPVLVKGSKFSVCLETPEGTRVRKQLSLDGHVVHLTGQKPCEKSFEEGVEGETGEIAKIEIHEAPAQVGMFENLKRRLKGLVSK
jgi:hypothetical protein